MSERRPVIVQVGTFREATPEGLHDAMPMVRLTFVHQPKINPIWLSFAQATELAESLTFAVNAVSEGERKQQP